jgi:ubiquinone/menaquinone biosynthesis C-methylase UbiE
MSFEDPTRAFANLDVASWMAENSPVLPGDLVLEVAAGTGLFGRVLAPRAAAVVALDITPEMLSAGKVAALAMGISNMVFQLGDAAALPFLDQTFDRTISRLAVHHFADPDTVLGEMARVCRVDGSVTVIDMVVPAETAAARFNQLERLRDPSHTRALTRAELRAAVESAELSITHTSTWENVLDGERWLEQTGTRSTDADIIRAAWSAELTGGPPTGMSPRKRDGRIEFIHCWELIVAKRTAVR